MRIVFPKESLETTASEGMTLLEVIRAAGLPIEAVCSGNGTCGKCRVSVDGAEELACRTSAKDGMIVEILTSAEEHVVLTDSISSAHPDLDAARTGNSLRLAVEEKDKSAAPQANLAIAVDVGTTTVVVKAVDTGSGGEVGLRAFSNPQRVYGADVLSRINHSMDDAAILSGIITEAVDRAIKDILINEAAGKSVKRIVIAGNTTMSYLLLDRRCRSLGLAPFEPEYMIDPVYGYREIFGTETLGCPVFVYPYISAFVGGDIVSGLVNIERHLEKGPDPSYMLIDMGTNGEIAYRKGSRLLTTSTAAGPALEGGNITCGMSGLPGAIYAAAYEGNGKFSCSVIGGNPALGICGSGVIDLMASLLDAGLVSESGAFTEEAERLGESTAGTPIQKQLVIVEADDEEGTERVVFTQKDVRELQLAKGAIRAGVDILIAEMGEPPKTLYLAGGFGQNIDLESAFRVGLIPGDLEGRIRLAGNTSLGGCVDACLDKSAAGSLPSLDIIANAQEINLGSHRSFSDKFMETMLFE